MKNLIKTLSTGIMVVIFSINGFSHTSNLSNKSVISGDANSECISKTSVDSSLDATEFINKNSQFVAYTNEAKGSFRLHLFSAKLERASLIVTNAEGKTLHNGFVQVIPGTNIITHNTGLLAVGIYNVRVLLNGKMLNEKLTVAN